jgi:hypothetical protein
MPYLILVVLLLATTLPAAAQSKQVSIGIFTGATTSYTMDTGISKDARYNNRYDVKFSPIGFNFGIDYEGYGFVISPSLIRVGQNYHVVNTVGGQEGIRKINLDYLNFPIGFKLHMIDVSFFRVSLVGGASIAYLLKGTETISHNNAKYRFPKEVYPALPSTYAVEYDGVIAPSVSNYVIGKKSDFNSIQCFASFGIRSDWDITDHWRISFDARANYGLLDPRSNRYLNSLDARETIYDLPGKRNDLFAYLNIGISRYIVIEKEAQQRKVRSKGSSKKFKPQKYPWVKPHRGKPST